MESPTCQEETQVQLFASQMCTFRAAASGRGNFALSGRKLQLITTLHAVAAERISSSQSATWTTDLGRSAAQSGNQGSPGTFIAGIAPETDSLDQGRNEGLMEAMEMSYHGTQPAPGGIALRLYLAHGKS
jgi:hypothetical protein